MSTEDTVANGIDARMEGMKAAACQPVADRSPAQAEREELTPGHHSVLALSELRDLPIPVARATRVIFGPDAGLE